MPRLLAIALMLLATPLFAATHKDSPIPWEPWSDDVFERAKKENRFVLMDLEAVWCHWCHVMEDVTYMDPKVIEMIKARYIPVRVDQDARPDISRRYEDYGWPATVVFNAEGTEIVKRRGYLPPEVMTSMLQEIIDDPSPVKYRDSQPVSSYAANPLLPEPLREQMEKSFYETHDPELGGMKQYQKFIDRDVTEYGLLKAAQGDKNFEEMTRRTLSFALKIMDPAWGGMYQYSTDGDWEHPHFEKIMAMQSEPMRLYAIAYGQFGDEKYLKAVKDIHRYMTNFMKSPEGAFYTSQDADLIQGKHAEDFFALNDADRRKQGIPRVDKNRYSRENGWMIQALATAYSMTGDKVYLDDAIKAARWIIANRSLPNGGFRHDQVDKGGPYLEDTQAMSQGMLAIYAATGDREWLGLAEKGAAFIDKNFSGKDPGFYTAAVNPKSKLAPSSNIEENVSTARFLNMLQRYTGNKKYKEMNEHAMRYLVTEEVIAKRLVPAGTLLAAFESANDPLHITIVGGKKDEQAIKLFKTAISYASVYRRIEWWDKKEGKMPNPDVQYPELPKAAAFICTDSTCSLPIFKPEDIRTEITRATGRVAENN